MVEATIPEPGRCSRCGEPLGTEPHWVVDPPHGEHVACRDPAGRPFPYRRLLALLRRRHRSLRRALRVVEELGVWLAEAQRRWPEGAHRVALEVPERMRRASEALDRAGVRPLKDRGEVPHGNDPGTPRPRRPGSARR